MQDGRADASGTRRSSPNRAPIEGVFVVGMEDSGADVVHSVLGRLGLRPVGLDGSPAPDVLAELNDRLLETLGGSRDRLPEVAPREAARLLVPFADEARRQFEALGTGAGGPGPSVPWVWADPANSLLAWFWAQTLAVNAAVVLIHREPHEVLAARAWRGDDAAVLEQWDRYDRAAVLHCAEWPAMVISHAELVAKPKVTVLELAEFLEECGVSITEVVDDAVALVDSLSIPEISAATASTVGAHHRVLSRVLDQLDGKHVGQRDQRSYDVPALMAAVATFYDESYYGTSYDQSGVPYRRGEKLWVELFDTIASSIVNTLAPRTVLDAGCASGMLVEALRNRGVDAWGIDISTWAIDQIPGPIRPYCRVGSITDELEGQFDLITCLEVLEHLPPSLAADCVANLCRHADAVLFSSTPDDFDEPTHLNVEPGSYWAQLFFRQGFLRDVDYDATFLAPHAVLFRRRQIEMEDLIGEYERGLWNTVLGLKSKIDLALSHHQQAVAEHDRLAQRYKELAQVAHQTDMLRAALGDLERRRSAENLASFEMVQKYETGQRRLAALVDARDAELDAIRGTKTFRYTTRLRRAYGWLRRPRKSGESSESAEPAEQPTSLPDGSYELWVEQFDTIDDAARRAIRERLERLDRQPLITVIMPVFNPSPEFLRAAIESVRSQLYTNWELCVADDCSTDAGVQVVLSEYASIDPRIKVIRRDTNGHISAASNTALAAATGEWVGGLDHDDVLAEHALALVALEIADHRGAGIVYSDEDKLDAAATRSNPYFKSDFDPLLLVGQNYLSHFCVFRRDLVTEVGGYRLGFEGSQDWDLTLRVSELLTPDQVRHVPHVLYHWRAHGGSTASVLAAKPYAADAGRQAVTEHLARTGRSGRVTRARLGRSGYNRVTWSVPEPGPRVSIIVPTRDGSLLPRCVDSVLAMTTYSNYEVVVVDNSSRSLPTLDYLRTNDDRVMVIRDERPFNYSAVNNAAVQRTSGEIVCLLNDDTEVISEDWLTEMVAHVLQPGVGAVGAKLYYDDGRIQHGGVVLGIHGVAAHSYRLTDRRSAGYFGRLQLAQHLSAVTAACVVVRREAWDQVGGLDEQNLPIAFNDVDFCLRLRDAGWGIVWTPYAELYHHESVSRGPDTIGPRAAEFAREIDYMQKRWGPQVLRNDPYYSPNLSLCTEDFSLAWPPRASYR